MDIVQMGLVLIGFATIIVGVRAAIRNFRQSAEDPDFVEEKSSVSYDTGRDESQWRRAYSRSSA